MGESLLSIRNTKNKTTRYVLDTNVLIHDPTALLNFEEHKISIPMTVLEELDSLKSGRNAVAADCRQAIRELDKILGRANLDDIEAGVPIKRGEKSQALGSLSIIMRENARGRYYFAHPYKRQQNTERHLFFTTTKT